MLRGYLPQPVYYHRISRDSISSMHIVLNRPLPLRRYKTSGLIIICNLATSAQINWYMTTLLVMLYLQLQKVQEHVYGLKHLNWEHEFITLRPLVVPSLGSGRQAPT